MNHKKIYQLEILDGGVVQLLIQTVYFKDDEKELARENWRTTLLPGEFERAQKLLDDYHMNIIKAAWTDHTINNFSESLQEVL